MGLYVALPLVLFILLLLWVVPVGLWLQAIFSIGGGHVTIFNLIGMRFRRVPPGIIVNGLIASRKAGIVLKSDDLEVHFMACLLYTSPSPRDGLLSRMPSSA